jgi:hypothetical protein
MYSLICPRTDNQSYPKRPQIEQKKNNRSIARTQNPSLLGSSSHSIRVRRGRRAKTRHLRYHHLCMSAPSLHNPALLVLNKPSRTSSPSNNSRPNQRTSQRTNRHRRHQPSCRPGNSRLGVAVPAGIASVGPRIRIVLGEVRTGPEAVRMGLAGLAGRGSGCRRSSLVRRRPDCNMRVACRRELDRHLGGLAVGRRAVRLGRMV